jgi:hypothetical protein
MQTHYSDADTAALRRIERKLDLLLKKDNLIMADLTKLTASVNNATTVEQSAITLIKGFSAELAAAGTDPVALKALGDSLDGETSALAAAVAANTPAAPAPPAASVA